MDLKGAFLDSEGVLLHSLPKSGGSWPLRPPGSYVPGHGDSLRARGYAERLYILSSLIKIQ